MYGAKPLVQSLRVRGSTVQVGHELCRTGFHTPPMYVKVD